MAPEGYEIIKYKLYHTETWVLQDKDGKIWFPVSEIFRTLFHDLSFRSTHITEKGEKHLLRLRMVHPRKKLSYVAPDKQPKDVVIFTDLDNIKRLIRSKYKLREDPKTRSRDFTIEEFAKKWGFSVVGFNMRTHRKPAWEQYPLIEQIVIAAEPNKDTWLKCVECERFLPATPSFFDGENVTCRKCRGKYYKIHADGYDRIKEHLQKRGRL